MKMEQTECSETLAYKIQTPGNYPEENIQHTEHGESLQSRRSHLHIRGWLYQSYRNWLHVLAKNFQTINKSILHAEDITYQKILQFQYKDFLYE